MGLPQDVPTALPVAVWPCGKYRCGQVDKVAYKVDFAKGEPVFEISAVADCRGITFDSN